MFCVYSNRQFRSQRQHRESSQRNHWHKRVVPNSRSSELLELFRDAMLLLFERHAVFLRVRLRETKRIYDSV